MRNSTKIYLSADLHLGETRFDLMQRPFKTPEEQLDVLLENFNNIVTDDDLLLIIGDVCNRNALDCLHQIKLFKGRKWLFRGNHDKELGKEQLQQYFERVYDEDIIVQITLEGVKCTINHYPTLATKSAFHLCGHIHSAWKFQKNAMNCGVDVHHFRPVCVDQLPFFLSSITNFYDEDVWVANRKEQDFPNRGKSGSYFEGRGKLVDLGELK